MNPLDPNAPASLTASNGQPLVPAVFAEKAMASLMQLHGELMDEKERRVDLYRRLMEKEQAVAELRMYVRMLEEKLGAAPNASAPAAARSVTAQPTSDASNFTTQAPQADAGQATTHLRPQSAAQAPRSNAATAPTAATATNVTPIRPETARSPKVVELPQRAPAQVKRAAPPPPPPSATASTQAPRSADGWKAW